MNNMELELDLLFAAFIWHWYGWTGLYLYYGVLIIISLFKGSDKTCS
jgi:hypothetical protein